MTKRKKRMEIPLGLFFLKYFGYLFIGILCIAVLVLLAFNMLWTSDIIYPARYAEQQAALAAPVIEQAKEVSEDMIPELCRYALFDENGNLIAGNLQGKAAKRAWEAVEGRPSNMGGVIGGYYYKVIRRVAGYCVLRYQIMSQYRSEFLRKFFPPPEVLILVITLMLVFAAILVTAVRFSRVMRRKLAPLITTADRIQRQELDFVIEKGSIREINAILNAMDAMREALRKSLEEQWRMEQSRKEQMSALAHDLKTPLTLVRGNAELICDTELTEEQRECAECIAENAVQMQNYVQMLIEITRTSQTVPAQTADDIADAVNCKRKIDVETWLSEVKRQAGRLCAIHQIGLSWNCSVTQKEIYAEPDLMTRALQNLLDNAARYTPQGGTVSVKAWTDEKDIVIAVSDTGPGFSEMAIRHGREQFYMDDDSRTAGSAHYGMGLYIVDTIVRQHGGTLLLENSPETHGACVTVRIPVSCQVLY